MEDTKKYYKTLGFSEEESRLQGKQFDDLLKKKYREACKKWHPDKWASGTDEEKEKAESMFKAISEANETLSDHQKRQIYDLGGSNDYGSAEYGGWPDIDDIADGMMWGFGRRRKRRNVGEDVTVRLSVTIRDILGNKTKKVTYKRKQPCVECDGKGYKSDSDVTVCPECNGTGRKVITNRNGYMVEQVVTACPKCGGVGKFVNNPCAKCNGSGFETIDESIEVPLMDGVNDGIGFKIQGKGSIPKGWDGTQETIGNLIVMISVEKDESGAYVDDRFNIRKDIGIGILDCITGTEYVDTYVDGKKISIKIPSGTKDGAILRIPGKGLRYNGGIGDYLVRVNQIMPKTISDKELKKINELKKENCFKK